MRTFYAYKLFSSIPEQDRPVNRFAVKVPADALMMGGYVSEKGTEEEPGPQELMFRDQGCTIDTNLEQGKAIYDTGIQLFRTWFNP